LDVLLDVVDGVKVIAEDVLVLEDRLGRLAIVHLRDKAAPRADERLEHDGVAELLNSHERRLGCERNARPRARHAVANEPHRREQLVPADLSDLVAVDRRHAPGVEDRERVESGAVLDAALEDHIDAELGALLDGKDQLAVVDDLRFDASRLELAEEELLLHPHAREKDTDSRTIHPSPLAPPERGRARAARSLSPRARRRNRDRTRSRL